ncbi:hypothetical protein BSKO_10640 [Bryopsis sp. KO-2023]|nr:hypothetical protein BSKO_10640 [Bryopsis sp. KO-2023]
MTTEIDAVTSGFNAPFPSTDLFAHYTATSIEEQRCRIDALYVENAVFEDNLLRVRGKHNIKAQFAALVWLFERVEVVGIEDFRQKSPDQHGNGVWLVSRNEQIYHLHGTGLIGFCLPKKVQLQVETCINLLDGGVANHSDRWIKISFEWCPPRLYGFVRRLNGYWLTFLLKWIDWFFGVFEKPKIS